MALDAENVLDAPMVPAPADMDDEIDRLTDEGARDFMGALRRQLFGEGDDAFIATVPSDSRVGASLRDLLAPPYRRARRLLVDRAVDGGHHHDRRRRVAVADRVEALLDRSGGAGADERALVFRIAAEVGAFLRNVAPCEQPLAVRRNLEARDVGLVSDLLGTRREEPLRRVAPLEPQR